MAASSMSHASNASAAAPPPYALEVTPDAVLTFTLSNEENASKCTMTVRHPGGNNNQAIAFKVKTTQPRRYLVRPNQGLVRPGQSESVSILLVEKDKLSLLSAYERVGPTALEHSKDKFLVQSCRVGEEFAKTEGKALAESLTAMWNRMGGRGGANVHNKKLHVKHVMASPGAGKPGKAAMEQKPAGFENMSPQQIYGEIASLRRKYDELVTFSVNLTAERDVLQNSLEQTKTELDRVGTRSSVTVQTRGIGMMPVLIISLVFFAIGSMAGKIVLQHIPVVGGYLVSMMQ